MPEWIRLSLFFFIGTAVGANPGRAQAPASPATAVEREEAAREQWQKVPEIFASMAVRPGAVVADVGAAGGFLTVRLAHAVGSEGRVIAVDIDARALERLRARVQQEGLTNVEVVKGEESNPHLTPSSLDAAVIVNSYHEMREYRLMLHHLRRALKPDGRLVIVEPLSEKQRNASREKQTREHEIAPAFVEDEAREAGFRVLRLEDPFTTRRAATMWLLVARPDLFASTQGAVCPLVPAKTLTTSPPLVDDVSSISKPDLRIRFDRFKKLHEESAVVVVDVRSEEEFRSGHIPGAIWIPFQNLVEHIARLRELGKPVVTYCS